MNGERWHIHLAGGQKVKWALDEDLLWAREALAGRAHFTALPTSRIVHAAWWPALEAAGWEALAGKTVVSFADNPPALYLTQPGFAEAAKRVDLWIARSREAQGQFLSLGLRTEYAPYCVDPDVFCPLPDRLAIRRELQIPEDAFVIGNFHRDTEGGDLTKPKAQKGADILLEIAAVVHRRLPQTLVLLAGPRRHWLRRHLAERNIPFRFVGEEREADDYEINILDRPVLNRLYQILDACVISSRWEGGPYSVLEALFAGRPVISTPVGIARDILPDACLYRSVEEGAFLLERLAANETSGSGAARGKVLRENTVGALQERLLAIYESLPRGGVSMAGAARSALGLLKNRVAAAQAEPKKAKPSIPGLLPEETPLAPSLDRDALERSAAAIAAFRSR